MKRSWLIFSLIIVALLIIPASSGAVKKEEAEARFIIMFKDGVSPYSVIKKDDVELDLPIINGVAMMANPQKLEALERTGKIESIGVDHIIEASETVETSYTRLPWGVNWIDSDWVWNHKDSDGNLDGNTGEGIHVAVLDTGIDIYHQDLAGNVGTGINFVAVTNPAGRVKSPAVPGDYLDDNGHGTHCAGIIAAEEATQGKGAIGVARGATVHPVKVLDSRGSGFESYLIAGIDWCSKRNTIDEPMIDVISMSLSSSSYSTSLATACAYAESIGIVLVAAAGNDGDSDPVTNEIEYPASLPSVISVGAVDWYYNIAYFSSSSPYVDVSAPGVNIWSTYPDDRYATMSGTSMACPHVAGTVALMLKKGIAASNIRSALQESSVDRGSTGRENDYGYGVVDALQAVGWDDIYSPMMIDWDATAGETTATVTFYTDEYASARIEYWEYTNPDTTYFSSWTSSSIFHEISLTGLTEGTKYIYKMEATDGINSGVQIGAVGTAEFTTNGGTSSGDNKMHVSEITPEPAYKGVNKFITVEVKIVDADGNPVDLAMVSLTISLGGYSASLTSYTGTDGYASFNQKVKTTGEYTVTVTNVVKDGWTYDDGSNVETIDTLNV